MTEAPEAIYPYADAAGALLFEKVRLPGKRFQQRRPNENGGYVYNLSGVEQVLYRLPALFAHLELGKRDPIYIVEGEKDADAIAATGATATTNPGGAGKWRDEHTDVLTGARHVIIVADRDEQGVKHATDVAARLRPVVDQLDVVQAAEGKDAFDHLQYGHALDELVPLELEEQPLPTVGGPHSWTPIDLLEAGANPPAPPTIAELLYRDRSHLLSGETEAVKTWLALIFAAELLQLGETVAYIDHENGPAEILSRLRHLGLPDEAIRDRFVYFHPDEAIANEPAMMRDLVELLTKASPALLVVDSWIGSLQTHGLDPNVGVDIERWRRTFLEPLRRACPAALTLDHVPKAPDARGRYAIGSERKASAAEVHLGAEVIVPFARGKTGRVRLATHKDRGGHLPRPRAAEVELQSDPDTLLIRWVFHRPEAAEEGATFRPTVLMERVSRHLEEQTAPLTKRQIAEGVTGKREWLFKAVHALLAEGYASENPAGGIISERPFREAEDA